MTKRKRAAQARYTAKRRARRMDAEYRKMEYQRDYEGLRARQKARQREAARRDGVALQCGISGKRCPHALTCEWSEMERRNKGVVGKCKRLAPIDSCAVAVKMGYDRCLDCPDRSRCKEAWRCIRLEILDIGRDILALLDEWNERE